MRGPRTIDLDPLARSDREGEVESWLDAHSVAVAGLRRDLDAEKQRRAEAERAAARAFRDAKRATTAPAAINVPAPTRAPLRTTAPIPTSTSSPGPPRTPAACRSSVTWVAPTRTCCRSR